eukprot:1422054-Pyramimonas_sp.AAC.1
MRFDHGRTWAGQVIVLTRAPASPEMSLKQAARSSLEKPSNLAVKYRRARVMLSLRSWARPNRSAARPRKTSS